VIINNNQLHLQTANKEQIHCPFPRTKSEIFLRLWRPVPLSHTLLRDEAESASFPLGYQNN